MLSDILILYILGLGTLLLSNFLGLGILRFHKNNNNIFLAVLLGYLAIVATYAIFKAGGNSVGIFVIMWILGYILIIKKQKDSNLIIKQNYLQNLFIIIILWSIIFILKASFFWNFEYNSPNLLFVDNEFYMKVAEGYNLSGNENTLGLRNMLFPFLNFAQPYRSNDFWLVSLGLDLTKMDTIYIWELFYSTIVIFICSLSIFELLKTKFNLFLSLILSVLILFAFSGQWYRDLTNLIYPNHSGGYDPIGIIAYTKLAIVFSIFFQFFLKFERGKKREAIYLLILIPLIVQSTIAVYLITFFIILICLFQVRKLSKNDIKKYFLLIGVFTFLFLGFLLFYYLNQQSEQFYIGYSNFKVSSNENSFDFIIQFLKKSILLFISYYWLSFLLVVFLLVKTKTITKVIRIELFVFLLLCYFCSILVYVWFSKLGDSYQFSTNVFGPFVLSLLIYLLVQTPVNFLSGKFKLIFLVIVSLIGVKQIVNGDNFFHSTTRIHYYDKGFISQVKNILPQLNYPLGIIYYGEDLQKYSKEDYPQHSTSFLKLFGRNYDVFNIEADSLKMNFLENSYQKINLSIKKNALNIWHYNSVRLLKIKNKLTSKDFYSAYPFSFCVSKLSKDKLPDYIQNDVNVIIKDDKSQIYFYALNRLNFKESNQ